MTKTTVDAAVLKTAKTTSEAKEPVQPKNATAKAPEKEIRKYEATDLIEVQSVTQGELLLPGKKSGILYRWSAYGDITEVEYQDLYTLKSSRSEYVYKPLFVILDEELLADARWKEIKAIYDSMYSAGDIYEILKLSAAQFKQTLMSLPKGLQDAVKIEVSTRLDSGTFDSISKIKAVDEICGTDLFAMMK